MPNSGVDRDVLKVAEVCQRLGVGKSAVYNAIRRGDIPVLKFGRRWVISRIAYEKMLEEGRQIRLNQ
jgi:excisionase family DNA binding protein